MSLNLNNLKPKCARCATPLTRGRCPNQIRIYYEVIDVKDIEEDYFRCPTCKEKSNDTNRNI
jgi:hypothetical protein